MYATSVLHCNNALLEQAIMPVGRHSVLLLKSQDPALVRTTSFFAMIDYEEVHYLSERTVWL
jgi:hypothetical protein